MTRARVKGSPGIREIWVVDDISIPIFLFSGTDPSTNANNQVLRFIYNPSDELPAGVESVWFCNKIVG